MKSTEERKRHDSRTMLKEYGQAALVGQRSTLPAALLKRLPKAKPGGLRLRTYSILRPAREMLRG